MRLATFALRYVGGSKQILHSRVATLTENAEKVIYEATNYNGSIAHNCAKKTENL